MAFRLRCRTARRCTNTTCWSWAAATPDAPQRSQQPGTEPGRSWPSVTASSVEPQTAAMVGPWMTFHSGRERIVGGIAQEIVERLVRAGASPGHIADSSDYVATITPFDPEIHKALLFEMTREAGVKLLLHAYVLDALVDGDTLEGARFATVGGTREYRARVVIDTTADAYVAASAGVPTQQGDDRGRVQPASLMFRLSHVDLTKLATYVRMHPDQMRTSLKTHERMAPSLTAVAGLSALWQQAREDGIVDSMPRVNWSPSLYHPIPTR